MRGFIRKQHQHIIMVFTDSPSTTNAISHTLVHSNENAAKNSKCKWGCELKGSEKRSRKKTNINERNVYSVNTLWSNVSKIEYLQETPISICRSRPMKNNVTSSRKKKWNENEDCNDKLKKGNVHMQTPPYPCTCIYI